MPRTPEREAVLGPDFVALQTLIDHCTEGDLYEDYDRAATIVADAQVALRHLWETALIDGGGDDD